MKIGDLVKHTKRYNKILVREGHTNPDAAREGLFLVVETRTSPNEAVKIRCVASGIEYWQALGVLERA